MQLVITGAEGFIGRSLHRRLLEIGGHQVACIGRRTPIDQADQWLSTAECLVHLAGCNRPACPDQLEIDNVENTRRLCSALTNTDRAIPVIFSSSVQAGTDSAYGRSKQAAERILLDYALTSGASVELVRLANVFGKGARPHYNSVVATFCHQLAHGLPLDVHDPSAPLRLQFIDDVVDALVALAGAAVKPAAQASPDIVSYPCSVGELAAILRGFSEIATSLQPGAVGHGLQRALYATFLSHLPTTAFSYPLSLHHDPRGVFAEILRTSDSGQFGYFTAPPGVTRGGHYHHTKAEHFVVVHGEAQFRFRQIDSGAEHAIVVSAGAGRVVRSIPGWAHSVSNTGSDELVVLIWANEVFDRSRPDTYSYNFE